MLESLEQANLKRMAVEKPEAIREWPKFLEITENDEDRIRQKIDWCVAQVGDSGFNHKELIDILYYCKKLGLSVQEDARLAEVKDKVIRDIMLRNMSSERTVDFAEVFVELNEVYPNSVKPDERLLMQAHNALKSFKEGDVSINYSWLLKLMHEIDPQKFNITDKDIQFARKGLNERNVRTTSGLEEAVFLKLHDPEFKPEQYDFTGENLEEDIALTRQEDDWQYFLHYVHNLRLVFGKLPQSLEPGQKHMPEQRSF